MATPNFIHIDKTLGDDGIVEIDFVNDGIEFGNVVYHASIVLSRNGDDPTIPLRGFRLLSGGGPLEFADSGKAWMFTVRTNDADGIVVEHLHEGTASAEKILVPVVEGPMLLTANHSFGLWRGGPSRLNLYTATTVLNTIYATTIGTTTVSSGVSSVFWSYTLAETEVIAGKVRISGRMIDSGTTHATYAVAEFRAGRSTGGAAVVAVISEFEDGSLGVGSIATTANGNDIQIELTYAWSGSIDWTITADLGRIPA